MPDENLVLFFKNAITEMEAHMESLQEDLRIARNESKLAENNMLNTYLKQLSEINPRTDNCGYQQIKLLVEEIKRQRGEYQDLSDELAVANNQLEDYKKKYFNSVEDLKENLKDVTRLKHEAELSRANIETCLRIQNDKFNEKLQQMQCFPIILEQKKLELDKSTEKLKITESALHSLAVDFESVLQRCDKATWELEEQNMLTSQLLVDKELLKVEANTWRERCNEIQAKYDVTNVKIIGEKDKQLEQNEFKIQGLTQELMILRDESARNATHAKEMAEEQRCLLQAQISSLETEITEMKFSIAANINIKKEMGVKVQDEVDKLERKISNARVAIQALNGETDLLKSPSLTIHQNESLSVEGNLTELDRDT